MNDHPNFTMPTRSPRAFRPRWALSVFSMLLLFSVPNMEFVHAAPTDLATRPISGATMQSGAQEGEVVAPNVMFVMDESASMDSKSLPDWAGGINNPNDLSKNLNISLFAQEKNSAFNGLAYKPNVLYVPPAYFTATGAQDTTTYPRLTKVNTNNWTAVRNDPFLNNTTVDLSSLPNVYSTVTPGEYCTNSGMRTCIQQTNTSTQYPVPAALRWCSSPLNATLPLANLTLGACQAVEVDNVNEINNFGYPRMPWPRTSTINITGDGSYTSIRINSLELLSTTPVAGSSAEALAKALQDAINACAFEKIGSCTVVGYRAIATPSDTGWALTIYSPSETLPPTPSVLGTKTYSASAFTNTNTNYTAGYVSNVKGVNLPTVISLATPYYPKYPERADCVARTGWCSYEEEMNNYANWWAYYRTRMLMMKTSTSFAFSGLDGAYRVGFMSINNKTGTSAMGDRFLNVEAFDPAHKKAWYDKLFSTVPVGNTPLRRALAQAGRLFAGKLVGTYNGQEIKDPVQYSCQRNIAILSTDGYWNEEAGWKLDGATVVGEQDGSPNDAGTTVLRPQLDGGVPQWTKVPYWYTKTVTQTARPQVKISYTYQTVYQLQKSTKTQQQYYQSSLLKNAYYVSEKTYSLQSRNVSLNGYVTPLQYRVAGLYPYTVVKTVYQLTQTTAVDIQTPYTLRQRRYELLQGVAPVMQETSNLQVSRYKMTGTRYTLQTRPKAQVQQRIYNTNYGNWGSWQNVNTCVEDRKKVNDIQCQRIVPTLTQAPWQNVPTTGSCTITPAIADMDSRGGVRQDRPGLDTERYLYTTEYDCQYTSSQAGTDLSFCIPNTETAPTLGSSGVVNDGGVNGLPFSTCAYYQSGTAQNATGTCSYGAPSTGITVWQAYTTCSYTDFSAPQVVASGCIVSYVGATPPSTAVGNNYQDVTLTRCSYGPPTQEVPAVQCLANAKITNPQLGNILTQVVTCRYETTPSVTYPASSCIPQPIETNSSLTWSPGVLCDYIPGTTVNAPNGVCTAGNTPSSTPANCTLDGAGGTSFCSGYTHCNKASGGSTDDAQTCTPAPGITCGQRVVGQPTRVPGGECQETTTWDANGQKTTCTDPIIGASPGCTGAACKPGWSNWIDLPVFGTNTTCTHNITGTLDLPNAGDVQCQYGSQYYYSSMPSCTPRVRGTITQGATLFPEMQCSYSASPSGWSVNPSCGATQANTPIGSNLATGQTYTPYTQCSYSAGSTTSTSSSCTPSVVGNPAPPGGGSNGMTPVGVTMAATYVQCAYVAPSTSGSSASSCTRRDKPACMGTGGGADTCTSYTPAEAPVTCSYTGWSGPYNGSCPVNDPNSGTPNGTQGSCVDNSGNGVNGGTCTAATAYRCNQLAFTPFADTNETCVAVANEVQCAYNRQYSVYYNPASACKPALAKSTGPTYTVTQARNACITSSYYSGTYVDVAYKLPLPRPRVNGGTLYNTANSPVYSVTLTPDSGYGGQSITSNLQWSLPGEAINQPLYVVEERNFTAGLKPPVTTNAAPPDNPSKCVDVDNDGTYTENKITCSTAPVFGATSASGATCVAVAPQASNNWVGSRCDEASGTPTPNTLADVAQYYYMTDLRSSSLSNCAGALGASGDVCVDNVEPAGLDIATWQHMTTYTLGLGASGLMRYQSDYLSANSGDYYNVLKGVKANSAEGLCTWQTDASSCNWPKPINNTQTNIDDLWHAAVNGRGVYYSATNATILAASLTDALGRITQKNGTASSVAVSSANILKDNNYVYEASFSTGSWTGQLVARHVDPKTGQVLDCRVKTDHSLEEPCETPMNPLHEENPVVWDAQALLDGLAHGSRNISTYDIERGSVIDFKWSAMSDTVKAYFSRNAIGSLSQYCTDLPACLTEAGKAAAPDENLVNYLRGDSTHEDRAGASDTSGKYYRARDHKLGDTGNADPVFVGAPAFFYRDKGYAEFKGSQASRRKMVYLAANDGMLHAFNAVTDTANSITGGKEAWAYVPGMVLPNLFKLADKDYSVKHRFFVDGTPVAGDVCVNHCSAADTSDAQWKTILVGGLSSGAKGYYALDVTDPASGPTVLWEITSSTTGFSDLGYSYGNPIITKLPDQTWVVLFTSGYNNATGVGQLYVVNAKTGALIRKISTQVGDADNPSGLSKIAAWADFPANDNTARCVYGGDLLGNLWHFEFNCYNDATYANKAIRIASLTDDSQEPQPVTTKPNLGRVVLGGGSGVPVRTVFVGTGKLLGLSDLPDKQVQTFYAITDAAPVSTAVSPRTSSLFVSRTIVDSTCTAEQQDKGYCRQGTTVYTVDSSQQINWSGKLGWYMDFAHRSAVGSTTPLGERLNTNPSLIGGNLTFVTNIPESKTCMLGGKSSLYYLDAATGGVLSTSTGGLAGVYLSDTLGMSAVPVNSKNGLGVLVRTEAGTKGRKIPPLPPSASPRRVSWRELLSEQ